MMAVTLQRDFWSGSFNPFTVRKPATAVEDRIREARNSLARIEQDIEGLEATADDLRLQIEKLERQRRENAAYAEPRVPERFFSDGLTWPEHEFLRSVNDEGCEDNRDENRRRAIFQNHTGWEGRVAA